MDKLSVLTQSIDQCTKDMSEKDRDEIIEKSKCEGLVDAAEKLTKFLNKHKVHLGNTESMGKLDERDSMVLASMLKQYIEYGGDVDYFVSGAGAYGNCVIC